nr:hypothetical protein CFP56_27459 [Quercus suber]
MLSKDHDPDDSASEGSRTKRRHDEDDGAGHLVEKATLMRNHSQNELIKSENLLLILRILVKGKFSTSLPIKGNRNKRSCDEDGGTGPSREGYSRDKPPSKDLEDVWLILKNLVQGMFRLLFLRGSKKLEVYCSGKRETYKSDIEELAKEGPSSQTHLGTH